MPQEVGFAQVLSNPALRDPGLLPGFHAGGRFPRQASGVSGSSQRSQQQEKHLALSCVFVRKVSSFIGHRELLGIRKANK